MAILSWTDFKSLVLQKDLAIHEEDMGDWYKLVAFDGPYYNRCDFLKSPVSADLTDYLDNYRARNQRSNISKSPLGRQKVAVYEPEGSFKSYVSHNLCDRTTWYQQSVEVLGQELTLDTGTTYNFPQSNLIDVEHGKITGEKDFALDSVTNQYSQTLRDKYKVSIYDDGVKLTSGYTIDYHNGQVTLDSTPSGTLVADYHYENGSAFTVCPCPEKILQIRHVEIQFTKNISFSGSIVQSIRAYNPQDPPNKIEVEHIEFQNEYDVISIGNEGKSFISQYGSLGHDVFVFPFAYGRTIDLRYTDGFEIKVSLENDIPMGGDWATITFYTTDEKI